MRRLPHVGPHRGRAGQQVRLPAGLHRRQRHRLRRPRPLHTLAQRTRPHAGMITDVFRVFLRISTEMAKKFVLGCVIPPYGCL